MPLRGLIYFGKLYSAYADKADKDIYGRIPISLPTPKYVVLYNGEENHGEETELLLDLNRSARIYKCSIHELHNLKLKYPEVIV